MYPSRILARAKVLVGDKLGSGSFTDSELIELLNDCVQSRVAQVRRTFPAFGAKTSTISQVAGTWAYSTPTDLEQFLSLRELDSTNRVEAELLPVDFNSIDFQGVAFTYEQAWKLNFVNVDETKDWTLMYTHRPVRMHTGTFQAVGNTTGTLATTATLGTVEQVDDYYNNAQLFDTTNWKKWWISDYVGSTKVATVDWVEATKPAGTPTYEIMPLIDADRWQALLSWDLAMSIMAIDRGDPTRRPMSHPYERETREFRNYWTELQRRVNETIPGVDAEQY